jgi:DNA-binding MarR family transcriptional regulator
MNIIEDTEILKALLPGPSDSIYKLEKELKEKNKDKNVNYPTLRRHVKRLTQKGFIQVDKGERKNGTPDERDTTVVGISPKGLAYIVLKNNMDSKTIELAAAKILQQAGLGINWNSLFVTQVTSSVRKTFEELRPKINLEFFDETYMRGLLYTTLVKNIVEAYFAKSSELSEELRKKYEGRLIRKSIDKDRYEHVKAAIRKDLSKVPSVAFEMIDQYLALLKEQSAGLAKQIRQLEQIRKWLN